MPLLAARRFALAWAICFLLTPFAQSANRPLPEEANVKAFAKLEGGRLELLVRVPLAALKDIQFPTRGDAGYLDLSGVKSMLPGTSRYWIASCFAVFQNGVRVSNPEVAETRISLNSDQSFNSYREARDHLGAPDLSAETNAFWDQVWLDVRFQYPLSSANPLIAIRPKLAALAVRVSTDMKYVEPDGGVRDFSFEGDPGLIYLDARWEDAGKQFLQRGFNFVLTSADFLLFLFCLALPFRSYKDFLPAVVAFTAAFSIALLASAFGLAPDAIWFRPLIETFAAVSILFAAFANIAGRVTPRRRALFALGTGCIFGFASAFDLGAKLQFGGSYPVTSALAFNAGAVLTIAAVVALLIPVLSFLFSFARAENVERIIVSALAADTAWGWLDERWARLSKIPFQLVWDAGVLAFVLRCLAVLVLLGGLLWFVDEWLKSHSFANDEPSQQHKRRTAA